MQLTLGPGVHDNLGHHAGQEVLDQAQGEAEVGPIVAVLENLEGITVEVNITVKIHLVEGLHWDLVTALVLGRVGGLFEGEVVLNATAGEPGLLVLTRRHGRRNQPESAEQGEGGQESDEERRLQTTADLP